MCFLETLWRRLSNARRQVPCFFVLASLSVCLARVAAAQQTPAAAGSPENPVSCSDPGADPATCSNRQAPGQFGAPQASPTPGENSTTPQVSPNYRDTENPARQQSGSRGTRTNDSIPEPLTEFQKFVASATGQVLPIFGSDLFRNIPSTFAPLDMAPVPSDYLIGPGDELRIRVWGQLNFEANVRVDRSGDVYLPRVGPVHVAGLSFSNLTEHMRAAVARVFRNFELTVDLGQIRAIQVYVAGQARHPGVYTVSALSTLLNALFVSGGPSISGSLRHIQLRRDGKLISELDVYDLLSRGDKSKDAKLLSGDIIFIPPVGAQVALTGSVRNSRVFELKAGETLNDLLTDAGGVSDLAAATHISIERIDQRRETRAIEVSFDESGLATPLSGGDLVHVFPVVPRSVGSVTLRGNIANPGRFAWHSGMRISDLIPDKESLLTPQYWWKRAQLGLPHPDFEPTDRASLSRMRQPSEPYSLPRNQNRQPGSQGAPDESYSSAEPDAQSRNQQDNSTMNPQLDRQGNPRTPAGLRESSSTLATVQSEAEGESRQPRTEVDFFAPEIDWDYAVIERLDHDTLKTRLIPFDLGRLVQQNDSSQNLELQAGDVVTIFSGADIRLPVAQQSKIVKLEGEFAHAGSYTTEPGETLRDLVRRAGGFTPSAYLYGSEFSRESTRRIQQTRIDEYVRTLEMQTHRGVLATAASATSSAQDLAGGTAAQSAEQDLVAQLKQIRATGRIVLEFTPESSVVDQVPDIALENGDRFVVPSRPSSVNVVGAVYDQNSFIYNQGRHVNAYLHLAGGPNRNADEKHSFVIRADGEVLSRDATDTVWKHSFLDVPLYPGDTVVVPEKVFKPSALRGVLEWSQLFSQLALGAAAISVLKN
jgi:protein involved in polysaccharide export with SLBB domain